MINELRKLDPRLRGVLEKVGNKRYLHGNEASVLVLAHGKLDEEKLKKIGATHIARLTEHIWSVRLPPDNLRDLHGLSEVAYVEAGQRIFPTLTRSVPSINARREDVGADVDGRGVVIGIIDYGIDWTLPDFCDETGTRTRIKYLWDQSLAPTSSEKSPQDFAYGVEYGEQEINRALEAFRNGDRAGALSIVRHRPWPARGDEVFDTDGHGTHVTGIASGNGASRSADCLRCPGSSGRYAGVAPRAWIVFVHLSRGRILQHMGEPDGSLGNSAELAEAIAYCYRMADALSLEQRKRVGCVINLSMGFNGGSHDGESLVERVIDTMLEGQGRGLVVAAGNQRQQRTYFTGLVLASEPLKLAWKMGLGSRPDSTLNEMEIWYPSSRQLHVRLTNHQNETTELVKPGEKKLFEIGGITGILDSERFTPLNGDARIYLQVAPGDRQKLEGVWTVELTSPGSEPVAFDAWIEKEAGLNFSEDDARQSKFDGQALPPEQRYTTLTVPATARRAIAVGAVGNLNVVLPRPYQQSGTGPTRDGRLKPDVVAPGINICSNNVGFDRSEGTQCSQVPMTGTSMAAPHAAGVIALMLQLNSELSSAQIKQILTMSAKPSRGRTGFDPQWGFGVLDAKGALQLVREVTT
jgi:subtilisin family serine protease